ncbi:MAG: hypothetical protein Q9182_000288 [Xanthomendoza sp. 2 TL-2023]
MTSPGPPQRTCGWLPAAECHKSNQNHCPLVTLPVFKILEANLQKPGYGTFQQQQAQDSWSRYISGEVHKLSDNAPSGRYRGRFLQTTPKHLISVFHYFDTFFFDGELLRSTDFGWVDKGESPVWLGRTEFNEGTHQCKIELALQANEGVFTGPEAMQPFVTLLHEMARAFIWLQQCRCQACRSTPYTNGRSDHGNSWFYLARLVEMVARLAFGFPVPLEMDWRRHHDEEGRLYYQERRQHYEMKVRLEYENARLGRRDNEKDNATRARFRYDVQKMAESQSKST